jgi:hypothetical protein
MRVARDREREDRTIVHTQIRAFRDAPIWAAMTGRNPHQDG